MGVLGWVVREYGLAWLGFAEIWALEYMGNILIDVTLAWPRQRKSFATQKIRIFAGAELVISLCHCGIKKPYQTETNLVQFGRQAFSLNCLTCRSSGVGIDASNGQTARAQSRECRQRPGIGAVAYRGCLDF